MRTLYMAFFSIAIAFVAIGLSGHRTFLYIGIAFLILAIVRLVRAAKQ
jgi:hypothetical protein